MKSGGQIGKRSKRISGTPDDRANRIPSAAKSELDRLLHLPNMTTGNRAVLLRLADTENENLRSEVWSKLRDIAGGREDLVVAQTFFAYQVAQSLRPPIPKDLGDYTKYVTDNPYPTTYGMMKIYAEFLEQGMRENSSDVRFMWFNLWQGDPSVDLDFVLDLIDNLADLFGRLQQANDDALMSLNLPRAPLKRGAKAARNTYFIFHRRTFSALSRVFRPTVRYRRCGTCRCLF